MRARTAVLALFTALAGCSPRDERQPSVTVEAAPAGSNILLACKGRVEGRSQTVEVGAAADGVIKSLLVEEGQMVRKGALLARIDCSDLEASLPSVEAESEALRQARVRLLRGSRDEERQIAAQKTAAARAVLERAALDLERMTALHQKNDVARAAVDDARRNYSVAEANLKEAIRHEELVNAAPLAEEVARLDAEIAAARHRVTTLEQKIAKCAVSAPADGTILRVYLRPGESFSTMMPRPLLAMADLSVRRVRAEIDERDVPKVRLGQRAEVFAETDSARRYPGKVAWLAASMGRKRVLSDEPSEPGDRDVLEALIDLDQNGMALPVGLRVIVQFLK